MLSVKRHRAKTRGFDGADGRYRYFSVILISAIGDSGKV